MSIDQEDDGRKYCKIYPCVLNEYQEDDEMKYCKIYPCVLNEY